MIFPVPNFLKKSQYDDRVYRGCHNVLFDNTITPHTKMDFKSISPIKESELWLANNFINTSTILHDQNFEQLQRLSSLSVKHVV